MSKEYDIVLVFKCVAEGQLAQRYLKLFFISKLVARNHVWIPSVIRLNKNTADKYLQLTLDPQYCVFL